MGVDVYGLNPEFKRKIPVQPSNDASSEEFEVYWRDLQDFEKQNLGYRFSRNWWSWRPIVEFIVQMINEHDLNVPLNELVSLSYNDGLGITNPEICRILSTHFDELISNMKAQNTDRLCLKSPYWKYKTIDKHGTIITANVSDEALIEKLDKKVSTLYHVLPEVDEVEYHSPHQTDIESLEQFSAFLKECNGFKIY
jgi:hypothetical protein